MKTILIIITSNPMKSHKPIEALRLASLSSFGHPTSILIYKTAYALLSEPIEKFVNSEFIEQYFQVIIKNNVPLYFIHEKNNELSHFKKIHSSYQLTFLPLNWQQSCQLIENSDKVFLF